MTSPTESQGQTAAGAARAAALTRRRFLIGLGTLAGGAALLAACGGSASTATSAPSAVPSVAPSATTAASAAPATIVASAAPSVTTAASTSPAASTATATTGAAATASRPATAATPSAAATVTRAATAAVAPGTAQATTAAIVAAATAFLATLSDTQRAAVSLAYPSDQQVATAANFSGRLGEQFGASVWSNYPISDVIRPGLKLGDLSDAQRQAAQALLAATFSKGGYQKILNIMAADQVLSDSGTNYASGAANYVLGLFGTPSTNTKWMLQYGGHHLGLNVTMQGGSLVLAPMLTGCQPATFTDASGTTIRPLGAESDKGFGLINALDATQQQQAILTYSVTDLVLGPGKDGMVLQPEGIPASSLNASQQTLLLDLIGEWVNILADAPAAAKLAAIKARLAETYFAWSGATTAGSASYFRVTGPTVIIEYAPQGGGPQGGGTGVQAGGINHIHTVYRDPTNEYGTGLS